MFDSKTIIEIYNNGGYKAMKKEFEGMRMPPATLPKLSEEAQKIWHRFLSWRWRKANPEFVKNQNKYYFNKYRKKKPYKCVCKRCGKEFDAPRPYYKLCLKCPTLTEMRAKEAEERKKKKEEKIRCVAEMYLSGLFTQEEVAEKFGTYQKQVSVWVKSYKNSCKKK